MLLTFLGFCGAALVLAMIPGPSTAVILRQAFRGGRRAALATIAANEVGLLFWASVAAFGFSALVAASHVAYTLVRLAGATVLVAMGLQSLVGARRLRRAAEEALDEARASAPEARGWPAFRAGLVTILANPKAAVFAASFLPQFVPPGAPVLPTTLLLAVVWAIVDTAWYVALLLLLSRMQAALSRGPERRALEQLSGAVLVALGVRLALERR